MSLEAIIATLFLMDEHKSKVENVTKRSNPEVDSGENGTRNMEQQMRNVSNPIVALLRCSEDPPYPTYRTLYQGVNSTGLPNCVYFEDVVEDV